MSVESGDLVIAVDPPDEARTILFHIDSEEHLSAMIPFDIRAELVKCARCAYMAGIGYALRRSAGEMETLLNRLNSVSDANLRFIEGGAKSDSPSTIHKPLPG